jgi:hypothetical protein
MVAKLPYSSANNLPCALFVAGKPVFYQLVKKMPGQQLLRFLWQTGRLPCCLLCLQQENRDAERGGISLIFFSKKFG